MATSISTELGLYVLIQQTDNSVLVQLINNKMLNSPPPVGLFGTVISTALYGPSGPLLGTPLTIVTIIVLNHFMEPSKSGGKAATTTSQSARR